MEIAERTERLLGTQVQIKLPGQHSGLFPLCFLEMQRIEGAFSRFLESSELSRLNAHCGKWQPASPEMMMLLAKAEEIRKATDGNFDICLKEALDALGYDREYSFKPKKDGIAGQMVKAGEARMRLDMKRGSVLLHKEIDFGGFGKGYALDRVKALLEANGVSHYYINAGGDIFARRGKEADCPPWEILLEHPDDPERAIGKVPLDNRAIAGSAPNRRKWGGHHHLINAKTRKSAQGAKAIFVTARTGLEADAYATAIFTAGFEEGIALSQKLPVEILFVSSEGKMYLSGGFGAELFD